MVNMENNKIDWTNSAYNHISGYEIFESCRKKPRHHYFFMTAAPKQYTECGVPVYDNMWYGTSVTSTEDLINLHDLPASGNTFVKIDPLLGDLNVAKNNYMFRLVDWVVIGADSGSEITPNAEWIRSIVKQCRICHVPVFMLNSLKDIWEGPLIQEYPIELIDLKGGYQDCVSKTTCIKSSILNVTMTELYTCGNVIYFPGRKRPLHF